jgi:hypothetical protein
MPKGNKKKRYNRSSTGNVEERLENEELNEEAGLQRATKRKMVASSEGDSSSSTRFQVTSTSKTDDEDAELDDEVDDENSDEEDGAENDSDEEEDIMLYNEADGNPQELTELEFEFIDFGPSHFHGIRSLFAPFIPGTMLSEIADITTTHSPFVGTIVSSSHGLFGCLSILPLELSSLPPDGEATETLSNWELGDFVLRHVPAHLLSSHASQHASSTSGTPTCGVLLNARVFNLPWQLTQILYSSISEDLAWAEEQPDLINTFVFDYIVVPLASSFSDDENKHFLAHIIEEGDIQVSDEHFPRILVLTKDGFLQAARSITEDA